MIRGNDSFYSLSGRRMGMMMNITVTRILVLEANEEDQGKRYELIIRYCRSKSAL